MLFLALFTSSVRISVSRELPDVVIFDEAIALRYCQGEKCDRWLLAGDRKLTEKVNKALFLLY